MRLSRAGKTIRNLLVTALLAALTAAALGFPPLTVHQMCRQVGRDLLLPDLEPIYDLSFRQSYSGSSRRTFVLAKSGPTYVAFQFEREGLRNTRFYQPIQLKMENGPLVTSRFGSIYITGDFTGVASATAEVTVQHTDVWQDFETRQQTDIQLGESKVFSYDCVLENDQVLSFNYSKSDSGAVNWEEGGLIDAVETWYRQYFTDIPAEMEYLNGSYGLDWDIPVEVTLYDEAGAVMDTLSLAVSRHDIRWDYY